MALQPAGKGVRYTRYEGDFLSTDQMLREGRVVERGTGPCIAIDTRPEADHFGYVFEALLEAPAEGLYQFRVTSDDGTVLLLDGKRILELDGSHSPETAFCYAVLEKGFHRLELRYFEDCEGQVLDASLTGPDGKLLPLSQWGLFLDECL